MNMEARSLSPLAQGSRALDPTLYAAIRGNIIARSERNRAIDRAVPQAIDATAARLTILHGRLRGRLIDFAGPHSPAYFGDQVLGRRSMTWEDDARLCVQAPDETAESMEPGLRLAQRTVMLLLSTGQGSLAEAVAAASEAMGMLQACAVRALEDGVVEPHEAVEILQRLSPVMHALHSVRSVAAEAAR